MPNYLYIILNDYIFNLRLNFKYKIHLVMHKVGTFLRNQVTSLFLPLPIHPSTLLCLKRTFAYPGKKLKEYFSGREGDNFCWLFLHIL